MSKQINQYTKTRISGTVQDDDLLDLDSTEDSGSTFESAKMTMLNLVNYLGTKIINLYNSNGTLPENRTVTSSSFWTKFLGGNVIVEMDNESEDYAFIINAVGGVENARLGYDQVSDSAVLELQNLIGTWFEANDGIVKIGAVTLPTGNVVFAVEGGISTDDAYYISNVKFIHDDGGTGFGLNALASITSGSLNTAVGSGALAGITNGIRNTAIGHNCFASLNGAPQQHNVGIGFNVGSGLNGGQYNVILGSGAGLNMVSAYTNVIIGGSSGATVSGNYNNSIAIGNGALIDKSNQMVLGSSASYISEAFFGSGIERTSIIPTALEMRLTNITAGETDAAPNFDWIWNGSQGTGTGVGSDHLWKVAPAGASGTTRNALVEVLRLKGNGNINMPNLPTSSAGLAAGDLWNNSGVLSIA